MGITLQGAGALAAGTVGGFQSQRQDNRAQAAENRTARDDAFQQVFNEVMTKRNDIDQPDPPPPPQAVPTGPPGATQGALPEDPNELGPNTLGTMTVRGAQAAPKRSRRDKYDEWLAWAQDTSVRAGGLEGLEAFNQSERLISQQQVMGYGVQAVEMLQNGNAGDAAKLANTALEASPKDTGMEFFAMDGKLYLQGSEGDATGPFTQEALQSMVESHLQDPDQWLDVRKQRETERAALKGEEQTDTKIGIAEEYLDIAKEKAPADLSETGARIYSLITNADAAAQRAATAADDTPGLTPSLIEDINNNIPTLIQNAKLDPGLEWVGKIDQPAILSQMQSGAIDVAKMNLLGQGNYADAISLAAYAIAPAAGIQPPSGANIGGIGVKGEGADAYPYVLWNGKEMKVPPLIYTSLLAQVQGMQGGGGALPTNGTK